MGGGCELGGDVRGFRRRWRMGTGRGCCWADGVASAAGWGPLEPADARRGGRRAFGPCRTHEDGPGPRNPATPAGRRGRPRGRRAVPDPPRRPGPRRNPPTPPGRPKSPRAVPDPPGRAGAPPEPAHADRAAEGPRAVAEHVHVRRAGRTVPARTAGARRGVPGVSRPGRPVDARMECAGIWRREPGPPAAAIEAAGVHREALRLVEASPVRSGNAEARRDAPGPRRPGSVGARRDTPGHARTRRGERRGERGGGKDRRAQWSRRRFTWAERGRRGRRPSNRRRIR
ncbi:hypothetical protein SAMN04488561_1780 [Jiangella alba]|uniref:Uncharacterized protein n=1 Tax=Jiangella alba TaxID=561176 RepID=A0A1H5JYF9_9ACTN|nr:hypothetical protein SAMN04488561_1780 [Jiangella alba]